MSDFTNELGVVDPIRPPAGAVNLANRVRRLPAYALGFLVLGVARAVVDVAASVAQVSPGLGIAPLLSIPLRALPDFLTLLIPVAVAWATQTTGAASPRVVRGSIAIGLSAVVEIAASFVGTAEPVDLVAHSVVVMASWLLLALGLLWLANGLEGLRRSEPAPVGQRAALAVVVIGVLAAVMDLGTRLLSLGGTDTEYEGAILIANITGLAYIATTIGWTFLARALVRGGGDAGRPRSATRAGAFAGWLVGLWLLASLLTIVVLVPFAGGSDPELLTRRPWSDIYLLVSLAARAASVLALVYLAWGLRAGLGSEGGEATE